LELQLAQIWEDVLNVRPIGVTDNFFTLGGHSLLAVRLIALLQQQFGQNLPLATLFLRRRLNISLVLWASQRMSDNGLPW
jgi:acyl carrier protein